MWAAFPCPTSYALPLLHYYVLLCEQLALALRHTRYYYYMTTYYCVSSLPLPYFIRVTTITWLRTTVSAACPCPTLYALLLLHYYVLQCEQLALALRHTRYYYNILSTTVWAACPCPTAYVLLLLRTTEWAACPCPTAYALLLLHNYVRMCEKLALALQHTRYYYYMTTYYCVSSLPLQYGIRVTTITYCVSSLLLPYGIRVTTIKWLRTTVWAACPCPTAYPLLLLHNYVLLCEQPALALGQTRYYYYLTTYYCVSSLPLPYGVRVTTITYYCVWAACSCPMAYSLLLLHYYLLLCEQLALALRHTPYNYYMTPYYWVSSLPFPYGIRVTIITYYCVSSLLLPYGIRVTSIKWLCTTLWAACPCPTAYALLLLHDYVLLCEQPALDLRHTHYYY